MTSEMVERACRAAPDDDELWGWSNRNPEEWTDAQFKMQERWFAFFDGTGPLPISAADYDRHWALEGPGRPEIWPPVSDGGSAAPIRPEERATRHGASCEGNRSRNE